MQQYWHAKLAVLQIVSDNVHNKNLFLMCLIYIVIVGVLRFQILTDDQTKLVFEVKKDVQGKNFLLELNKAIGGDAISFNIIEF